MDDRQNGEPFERGAGFDGARPFLDDSDSAFDFRYMFPGCRDVQSGFSGEVFNLRSEGFKLTVTADKLDLEAAVCIEIHSLLQGS